MNATLIIILVIAAVVVVALIVAAVTASRRRALRERFGPEYDRVVADKDSRSAAERELRDRERRHAELELKPLSPESRAAYTERWRAVQAQFVDAPEDAVRAGDALVTRLVGEIGYPTENYDDQLATLSVEHATTLGHYRDAHDIFLRADRGEASTEQLRQALVHYRALFAELVGDQPVPPAADEPARAATDRPAGDVPAADERAADERAADERAAEEQVADERAAEERPAPRQPATAEEIPPDGRVRRNTPQQSDIR
jgi:hypothetical protein